MNVDIDDQRESVLPRTEYTLTVTHDGATPNRLDIKEQAHLLIDDDKDTLLIRQLPSTYSGKTFTVEARQYHDEDAMHHIEHADMITKNQQNTTSDEDEE